MSIPTAVFVPSSHHDVVVGEQALVAQARKRKGQFFIAFKPEIGNSEPATMAAMKLIESLAAKTSLFADRSQHVVLGIPAWPKKERERYQMAIRDILRNHVGSLEFLDEATATFLSASQDQVYELALNSARTLTIDAGAGTLDLHLLEGFKWVGTQSIPYGGRLHDDVVFQLHGGAEAPDLLPAERRNLGHVVFVRRRKQKEELSRAYTNDPEDEYNCADYQRYLAVARNYRPSKVIMNVIPEAITQLGLDANQSTDLIDLFDTSVRKFLKTHKIEKVDSVVLSGGTARFHWVTELAKHWVEEETKVQLLPNAESAVSSGLACWPILRDAWSKLGGKDCPLANSLPNTIARSEEIHLKALLDCREALFIKLAESLQFDVLPDVFRSFEQGGYSVSNLEEKAIQAVRESKILRTQIKNSFNEYLVTSEQSALKKLTQLMKERVHGTLKLNVAIDSQLLSTTTLDPKSGKFFSKFAAVTATLGISAASVYFGSGWVFDVIFPGLGTSVALGYAAYSGFNAYQKKRALTPADAREFLSMEQRRCLSSELADRLLTKIFQPMIKGNNLTANVRSEIRQDIEDWDRRFEAVVAALRANSNF